MKHVQTGMCIIDTRIIQASGSWGNLSFVELSSNCLDPAAQFRFRDNGAMLNLKRPGCLFPTYKSGPGQLLDMFYLYVNSKGLDTEACAERVDRNTDPAITQTSWGGLSMRYKGYSKTAVQTWCAVPKTDSRLQIDTYIGLTTSCNDAEDKRFNFGKIISVAFFKNTIIKCYQPNILIQLKDTKQIILYFWGRLFKTGFCINLELYYHHVQVQ